jgi:uncharacterized metal-binding protein
MPSGRTHDRITLYSLPITAVLSLTITQDTALTLTTCGGFLFSGLMLGPDLDVRSLHFKRWGWFRWIWLPYQGSLKHRSPLSHGPITGTVVRVMYLLIWVGIAWLVGLTLLNEIAQLGWTWEEILGQIGRSLHHHWPLWVALLIGLELGAFSHYIADWGVSTHKRVRKQGWRSLLQPSSKSRKRKQRK